MTALPPKLRILATCHHTLARRLYKECTCGNGHDSGQYARWDSCTFLFAIAFTDAISILFVYMLLRDLFVFLHIYLFIIMFVHLALVLTFLSVLLHLRLVLFCWCLVATLHVCLFVAMLVQQDIALLCLSVFLVL